MKIHEWFSLVYPKKEEIILEKKKKNPSYQYLETKETKIKRWKEVINKKICFNLKVKKLSKIIYIENDVYKDCINLYVYVHMHVCTYLSTCIHKCVCMYMNVCKYMDMHFQSSQGIEESQTFK